MSISAVASYCLYYLLYLKTALYIYAKCLHFSVWFKQQFISFLTIFSEIAPSTPRLLSIFLSWFIFFYIDILSDADCNSLLTFWSIHSKSWCPVPRTSQMINKWMDRYLPSRYMKLEANIASCKSMGFKVRGLGL